MRSFLKCLIISLAVFCLLSCDLINAEETKKLVERIKSTEPSLDRDIKITITEYDEIKVSNVEAAHVRKETKDGLFDKVYISGAVEPLIDEKFIEIKVIAEFYNKRGKLIARESTDVLPRVLGMRGFERGHFTISTDYDPLIVKCSLRLGWQILGKADNE